MKRRFRDKSFRSDSLASIRRMNEVVEEYAAQGLRLTGRQLYYQFVSRDWIPNTERSYKNLLSLLADARYAGMVDWDAIEDRGRVADVPATWDSIESIVDAAIRQFHLPVWDNQPVYVELWVEKQALAGVLEPLAREFRATLVVNKGYSSASAMYEAANRIAGNPYSRPAVIFYLGDHDPSGEDMVRDIGDRLREFAPEADIDVQKLALTMEQVRRYNPPPNPLKRRDDPSKYRNADGGLADARAVSYVEKFGLHSWEVDALPPNVLAQIIREAFDAVIDREAFDAVVARERRDSERVRAAIAGVMKGERS